MSLTGAFVTRYNDDVDDDITALRTLVGETKAWADIAIDTKATPYLVVKHITTALESQTKGSSGKRIMDATIQIDVWDSSGDVDSILDLIETAYLEHPITIANRNHLSTQLNNRLVEQEKINLWHGIIEFRVLYEKP